MAMRGEILVAVTLLGASCARVQTKDRAAQAQPAATAAAAVDRGRALYAVVCAFCHGPDARGGETGPNLLHSELVLKDRDGDLITPIVQNGRPDKGMPKVEFTAAQVRDIAAFIHTFRVDGNERARMRPPSIVVGDARAGATYFASTCARCHSVDGDLKGIGAKFADAKALQMAWLMPRGREVLVTVTLGNERVLAGHLNHIDDFVVGLTTADGGRQTVRLSGSEKVVVRDPLQPHRDLLSRYTDRDIHDVTAYLAGIR